MSDKYTELETTEDGTLRCGRCMAEFAPLHQEERGLPMSKDSERMIMSKHEFEFVDRYSATGTPYPDPATMCEGDCEGMGCYPHRLTLSRITNQEEDTEDNRLWHEAHNAPNGHDMRFDNGACDGYHFIKCSDCGGTGKKPTAEGAQPSPTE